MTGHISASQNAVNNAVDWVMFGHAQQRFGVGLGHS